jgi:hypothetical protein
MIVTRMSPLLDNILAISLFYFSLAVALTGTFAIVGAVARISILQRHTIVKEITVSLRQSFFFASTVIYILILQHSQILFFWNVAILIIVLTVIELLCASYKK